MREQGVTYGYDTYSVSFHEFSCFFFLARSIKQFIIYTKSEPIKTTKREKVQTLGSQLVCRP